MLHNIKPMLATLADAPFDREGWLFEVKWDGYRALADVGYGNVNLYLRNGQSCNDHYPEIINALRHVKHQVVLDGEIVALDEDGSGNFQKLQQYAEHHVPLTYMIFDLLYLDGEDLRSLPLRERKAKLKRVLPKLEKLKISEHIETRGEHFFKTAQEKGYEGIIAKYANSPYLENKRGPYWLTINVQRGQETWRTVGNEIAKAEALATKKPATHSKKLKLTNLDKVFWPREGYTKGDLLDYYERIGPTILPYLIDRPESLNRHPNGIDGKNFFQKNFTAKLPSFVETAKIYSQSKDTQLTYLLCQNVETLLYLANLGCIELNPWNSRVGMLEYPDYLIIDLDPGENKFYELVKVAREVHDTLNLACQDNYLKTSGKTGLHIFVPLGAKYRYDEVKQFAELIATIVNKKLPKITSIERSPSKRQKLIYLDFLQNRYGQTLAAPYSVRPWPGASVSTPLKWEELKTTLKPQKFTIKTIEKRLKEVGDLWEPVRTKAIDLRDAISCLENHLKR
ncbi:MAG: non-homologous end-joining DNA ligase [Candidatus Buchananbacteria bacterium]|nr:non-homologous end-joining DNA ligase [Candidatus Buchananbacteria bacterium]